MRLSTSGPVLLAITVLFSACTTNAPAQGLVDSTPSPALDLAPASGPDPLPDLLLRDPAALVRWVERHSHDLLAEVARVRQAAADEAQAGLVPNPNLGVGVGDAVLGRTNPRGLSFRDTSNYTIGLTQLVELGKRGPRTEAAHLRVLAEQQTFLALLVQKTADLRLALGRVIHLRARLAAVEENLASLRRTLELERARMEQGDLSGNEFDRLQLDTLLAEQAVPAARVELTEAVANAQALLGQDVALPDGQPGDLDAAAPVPALPAEVEPLLAERPDLRALELAVRAARTDAELARRRVIPDPTIGLTYTHDNLTIAGNQEDAVAVSVSVPLPLFDRGQHDSARAEQRAHEIASTRAAALAHARAEIASLAQRRTALEGVHAALEREALPRARAVLDTTQRAFDRGQVSLTDLLLARRTFAELALRLMESQFELFMARNELRRALAADSALVTSLPQLVP